MGTGMTLLVVGAILAFAVEDGVENVNLDVVGLILMLAGAATWWHARQTAEREKRVVRREVGPDLPQTHVVEKVIQERNPE